MKNSNIIGLREEDCKNIAEKLNILLANYSVFYQNTRGAHWNIKGEQFFVLHPKFEELYDNLVEPTRRVYVQLEEQLSEGRIVFVPKVVDKSEGEEFYAHTTYKFSEICRYPNNDIYTMIPDILEYIRKEVEKI